MPPVKRKRDLPESADYDLPAAKRAKVEPEETNSVEVTEESKKSKSATENLATDTDNIRKRKRSASEPADRGYEKLENERRVKRARTADPEGTLTSRSEDAENKTSIEDRGVSRVHVQEPEKEDNVETKAEPRGHEQKKAMNVEDEDVLKAQTPEHDQKGDVSRVQETENKAIAEEDLQQVEKKGHVKIEANPTNVNENKIEVEEKEGSAKASETSTVEETKVSASGGWPSCAASSTSPFAKAAGSTSIFGSVPSSKPVYNFGHQREIHEAEEGANDCDTSKESNIKESSAGRAPDTSAEPGGFAGLASQPSAGSGFPGQEKEWSGESPKASGAFKPENSNGPAANVSGAHAPLGSGFATTFGTPSGFTPSVPKSTSGFQTQAPLGSGCATTFGTPSAFTQSPLDSGFASPSGTSSGFAGDLGGGFATPSPFGNSSGFAASVSSSTSGFQTKTPFSSGFGTPLGTSSAFTTPSSTQSGFTASVPSPTSVFGKQTPFDTPSKFAASATKSTYSFGFGSQEKNNEKAQSFNPFGPFQPDKINDKFATGFNSYPSPGSPSGLGGDSFCFGQFKGSGGSANNLGTSEGENAGGKGKTTGAFGSQAAFGNWTSFWGGVSFGAGGPKTGAQESSPNTGTSKPANAANGFGSYASAKSSSFGNGEGPSVFGSKASGLGSSPPEWSFSFDDDEDVDDDENVDDCPFEDPDNVYEREESPKDEEQHTRYNDKPEKAYLKNGKIRMPDYNNIMSREEREIEDAWNKARLAEEQRAKLRAEAEKKAKEAEKKANEAEKNAKEAAVKAKAAEEKAMAKANAAEVRARAEESRKRRWNEYYGEDVPANASHEYICWGLDSGEFFSRSNCDQVRAGQKGCPFPKITSTRCRLGANECVKAQTLRVCQHDLLRVLKGSRTHLVDKIKAERNRWHPDKINHKMGHNGKRWEVYAKEMFQMLVALSKTK